MGGLVPGLMIKKPQTSRPMKIFHLAAAAALTFQLPTPFASGAPKEIDGVAAIVNGKVITKSEVRTAVAAQRQMLEFIHRAEPVVLKAKLAELESETLETMIDRELILKEFEGLGGSIKRQYIDDDINRLIREQFEGDREKFIADLARTGMSISRFRDLREKMMIVQYMRHNKTGDIPPVAPSEVEQEYRERRDELRDKSEDKVNLHTITIPVFSGENTKDQQLALAKDLRKKLVAGADFAETARSYSQDSKAEGGGAWGWVDRTLLNETLAESAFALPAKTVSEVVEDGAFFRILYVEARALSEPKPLSEVRSQIERLVEQKKAKEIHDRWVALLRKDAIIRRF